MATAASVARRIVCRRAIVNLGLLAAIAALALAWWLTRGAPAPAPEPVSDVPVKKIARIAVHTRDNVIALSRDAKRGVWRVDAPVVAAADADRVEKLLQLAAATPTHRYARGAIDDDTTGLDAPALVVRYNDEAPIAIGRAGPTPSSRYVRTAHALLLVDAPSVARQRSGWSHWLSPRLLAGNAHLTQLTLPRATLTPGTDHEWQVAPATADRGADYARATVAAWRHARAVDIEPQDASRQRSARVTLAFADRQTRHFDVIARAPELILRDPRLGVDYHLAANRAGPLLDMQHPDLLRADRAHERNKSAIPLAPEAAPRTQRTPGSDTPAGR